MSRSVAKTALVLLALGLGGSSACGTAEPETRAEARPPVLLFALDGLEWSVLLPLFEEGRLPTLRALSENGVAGKLETLVPTRSPRIWTSIATGRSPEAHGILDFVRDADEPGQDPVPYTSLDRKVKAFWNVLSDYGVRSATLGWWATWPVEPVDGFLLAQTNTKSGPEGPVTSEADAAGQLVFPPAREARVLEVFDEHDRDIDLWMERVFGRLPDDLPRRSFGRMKSSSWALRADLTYLATAHERLSEEEPFGLLATYIGGTDVVGHRFWAAHSPAEFELPTESEEVLVFGQMVRSYYEFVDRELERLLAAAPRDVNVLIVSDHGMGRDRRWRRGDEFPRLSGLHAWGNPGVLIGCGPAFESSGSTGALVAASPDDVPTIAGVMDVCPLLLWLCGVPHGEDLEGHVPEALLDPAFLAANPIRTIPTHEDPRWQAARAARAAEFRVGAESAERIEQLEALGYFEDVR